MLRCRAGMAHNCKLCLIGAEPAWLIRLECTLCHTLDPTFKSYQWFRTCRIMWIKKAQLLCWSLRGQQVLHQRWTWEIHCIQARKHTSLCSILALKPRPWAGITNSSKQGYQWPHKKDWCPPTFLFEKLGLRYCGHSGTKTKSVSLK